MWASPCGSFGLRVLWAFAHLIWGILYEELGWASLSKNKNKTGVGSHVG